MSFYYSESNPHSATILLQQLLGQLQFQQAEGLLALSSQRFKKEIELYSADQAKQVLFKLLQKGKTSAQRKNWKLDETNYLLFVVDKFCLTHSCDCSQLDLKDWQQIANMVPSRDAAACQFRFLSLAPANISHVPWSNYQRQLLLQIIEKQDTDCLNWKAVSEQLYQQSSEKVFRTGKQCRQHYTCFLKPNLKKGAWTDSQDYLLISLFLKLGKKWSKMTRFIEGRNENSIKNRFFLMFENKKDGRLTNSDLVKMVRRRKDKLERKLAISNQQKQTIQEQIHLTPNNSDSSNFDLASAQQIEGQQQMRYSFVRSQIFLTEKHDQSCMNNGQQTKLDACEQLELSPDEEFQKYIDL